MNFGYSNINKLFSGEITPGTGGLSEYEVKQLIKNELDPVVADMNSQLESITSNITVVENEISVIETVNTQQTTLIEGMESDVEDLAQRITNLESGSTTTPGVDEDAVKAIIEEEISQGGSIYKAIEEIHKKNEEVVYVEYYEDLPAEGVVGTIYIVDETDTSYHWSPGLEDAEGHYDPIASSVIAVDESGNPEVIMPSGEEDIEDIFTVSEDDIESII